MKSNKYNYITLTSFLVVVLVSCDDPKSSSTESDKETVSEQLGSPPISPQQDGSGDLLANENSETDKQQVTEQEQNLNADLENKIEITLPFGTNEEWFSQESIRFQREIGSLKELPEGVPTSWFSSQSSHVQEQVLKRKFQWGKNKSGKIVLGIRDADSSFLPYPNAKVLDTKKVNSFGQYMYGYPMVPGTVKYTITTNF